MSRGLSLDRNYRCKVALRRNSGVLTIMIFSFWPSAKSHKGSPPKPMLLNFLSLPTKIASNVLFFYCSNNGKNMAEHQVTEFLEEIWKLGLIIQYIKAARCQFKG